MQDCITKERLETSRELAPQEAGVLAFPAQHGTYRLDVLSLDPAAKRATVRLRFVP